MRVSILNINFVAKDAIGTSILNQVRFFLRRGDDVRVYVAHPSTDIPSDVVELTRVVTLAELLDPQEAHFRLSDLCIYHYPSRHPLMESIKTIERGAVIFYYHNVTPPALWNSAIARDELQRGVDGVSLVHYADLAVADSPFNVEDLVQRGYDEERIHVLPLAVPLESFTPGPKPLDLVQQYGLTGQRMLLFVGRMASNKRVDLLVEALPQIRASVPNVKLLLVGDGESSEPYRQVVAQVHERAAALGVADAVQFTGIVGDLVTHYRLADVYVTASLHEGFGVPLIEAMAAGTPVVASRIAAHPWVLGDAGLLCEPENPADMAAQVIALLQDDRKYGKLVQRGLQRAREFSLEAYEVQWAEIVDVAMRWVYALPPLRQYMESTASAVNADSALARERRRPPQDAFTNLYVQSDVMLRGYVVRSRIPLLGAFIAWLRRNLTSHLREPYLDPTLERQVQFNHRLVAALERLQLQLYSQNKSRQPDIALLIARQVYLEQQIKVLEARHKLAELRLHGAAESDVAAAEAKVDALIEALAELELHGDKG